jgi:hypothetical protein
MNITFEQADYVDQQAATFEQTQPSFYLTSNNQTEKFIIYFHRTFTLLARATTHTHKMFLLISFYALVTFIHHNTLLH